METFSHNRLTIDLHNDELDTMREIARLAHDRIRNASKAKMRGLPIEKQAGLCGPELFLVKEMLEKLGKATGVDLPMDAPPNDKPQEPEIIVITIIGEVKK